MSEAILSESRSNAQLRCGDCQFYKDNAHPAMGQPCTKLGVQPSKVAPPCWSPNIGLLRPLGSDSVKALAGIVTSMTPQQSRVFMGLLKGAGSLDRVKLTFLQEVFFKLGQGDALDLYYRGYVVARGADNTVQVLASPALGTSKAMTAAYIARSSVLTRAQFERVRSQLVADGCIYHVPRKPKHVIADASAYEPPTFDTSPEELEARAKRAQGSNKRQRAEAVKATRETKAPRARTGSIFRVDTSDVDDGL